MISPPGPKRPDNSWFPSDHSRQVDAYYFLNNILPVPGRPLDFLDLGAGPGGSFDRASKQFPELNWIGVDIADSGPVRKRRRTDCRFVTYDGVNIPADDSSIDVVFSRQTFEHVRHPEALLKDIHRVLRPGGAFIGSVSQLEPYHAQSFWNFTYYGFATLVLESAMKIREFRPGVDALTLIVRNILKLQFKQPVNAFNPMIDGSSPLNTLLDQVLAGRTTVERNRIKVHVTGHLCFWCERPTSQVHG
jgi:SAM-dependent methyltransferase